jgi:CheY-like chemotaxis protein
MSFPNKPVLLYAEDDLDDFESLVDALEQLTDKYQIVNAKNGTEVISMLQNDFSEHHPSVVILDLNMPLMDGKEVLAWMKSEEEFKHIPVMVFTTSSREEDVRMCQSHKCTFFRKPTLYRDLLHVAQIILEMSNGVADEHKDVVHH